MRATQFAAEHGIAFATDSAAQENLYARGVALFGAALRGEGAPEASGEDGVRSLVAALAVPESARTGQRVLIPV